nr:immunoglobulin light chain junction region [Macaca mulatta]MOX12354.1 immunoglobulin light chain junction region [Macaca mulatta]MOX13101.1 immunoglobulin light chain junction region [Macaca mulatta]MOX14255.1 immunoglobulin light chain junction region [Macaca mulatta]
DYYCQVYDSYTHWVF